MFSVFTSFSIFETWSCLPGFTVFLLTVQTLSSFKINVNVEQFCSPLMAYIGQMRYILIATKFYKRIQMTMAGNRLWHLNGSQARSQKTRQGSQLRHHTSKSHQHLTPHPAHLSASMVKCCLLQSLPLLFFKLCELFKNTENAVIFFGFINLSFRCIFCSNIEETDLKNFYLGISNIKN